MLIVDAHEDLAWNMLTFGRDYTRSAAVTRRLEVGSLAVEKNNDTVLGWPDYVRGRVALVFATLFAAPRRFQEGPWEPLVYDTPAEAELLYQRNLDAYERLVEEHPDHFRLVKTQSDLQAVLAAWRKLPPPELDDEILLERDPERRAARPKREKLGPEREAERDSSQNGRSAHMPRDRHESPPAPAGPPVGLVLLMEGAEGVREPARVEEWWAKGVRMIGPAWMGGRFSGGTREPGPMTSEGYALLEAMAAYGFALDISHMDEKSALQALDAYPGRVIASHSNAKALLRGTESHRHLTDRMLRALIEHDGIAGIVPFNAFLKAGWMKGEPRQGITLQHVAAHIDYVCQMAGDARHVGIGTDFDGGFGLQSAPEDMDTIADLRRLIPLLAEKGYTDTDIAAILGENWIAHLERIIPAA